VGCDALEAGRVYTPQGGQCLVGCDALEAGRVYTPQGVKVDRGGGGSILPGYTCDPRAQ
jgi:hypothetical protein